MCVQSSDVDVRVIYNHFLPSCVSCAAAAGLFPPHPQVKDLEAFDTCVCVSVHCAESARVGVCVLRLYISNTPSD